jgi:lipopolysaccharide/colanic/teichoic acid biosynthesis glycosyltransferase
VLRRIVDLAIAIPALVMLSPSMAFLAVAIRLESAGSALYRQIRVGRDGVPFEILKFRTMRPAAETAGFVMGGPDDPRITRLGRILRRSRLDELPQLVNVLRGDMTLIGPRAEVPEFVALYTPEQREVLRVPPGITGSGQLDYATRFEPLLEGATNPNQVYIERILAPKLEIDLEYLRTRSVKVDLEILIRTARLLAGIGRQSRPPPG